jgi:type IV pilus assembly protein PilA
MKRKGGFTLIELMIVVAIIGILAAIAIPNFLRFQLKAKTSEGKTNLAAIRTAEESYYAEYGIYVSSNASPTDIPGAQKVEFEDMGKFDTLGWLPEGNVYFNYGVGTDVGAFFATAAADIDADDDNQMWGYKKGSDAGLGALTPADHAGDNGCTVDNVLNETVSACAPTYGQSIF